MSTTTVRQVNNQSSNCWSTGSPPGCTSQLLSHSTVNRGQEDLLLLIWTLTTRQTNWPYYFQLTPGIGLVSKKIRPNSSHDPPHQEHSPFSVLNTEDKNAHWVTPQYVMGMGLPRLCIKMSQFLFTPTRKHLPVFLRTTHCHCAASNKPSCPWMTLSTLCTVWWTDIHGWHSALCALCGRLLLVAPVCRCSTLCTLFRGQLAWQV